MTASKVIIFTYWELENMELRPAIQPQVNTIIPVEWTEITQPLTAVEGSLAMCYGYYPDANEYPTLTAATAPVLAAGASRHFLIANKVESGGNWVTNFEEQIGAQHRGDLMAWLAVWFPAVRGIVLSQIAQATHRFEAARSVALAVNPTCPPFPTM